MTWQQQAACRSKDPELFFPIGDSGPALIHAEEAKQVCRTCPVRADCLDYALDNPTRTEDGIWGATTPPERRAMRSFMTERTATR